MKWTHRGADASAKTPHGTYEIEQGSGGLFWAFADDAPIGTYKRFDQAMQRCETIDQSRRMEQRFWQSRSSMKRFLLRKPKNENQQRNYHLIRTDHFYRL